MEDFVEGNMMDHGMGDSLLDIGVDLCLIWHNVNAVRDAFFCIFF